MVIYYITVGTNEKNSTHLLSEMGHDEKNYGKNRSLTPLVS
jgi:hypothetical protein